MKSALSAQIYGRVQGVGFRYAALAEAQRLGLTGWVRNNPDDSVEVWAEGEDAPLAEFLRWLNRGPRFAAVETVNSCRQPATSRHSIFTIA
ncbi:hypothetical protein AGMMS49959_07750 [Planctomycetales bacterium]|nr:hypothetical protein AGMMS49959_07750 [Planctomycetales bacterium]